MQNSRFDSQSGKSIVEILVVLAIAAILVTMALVALGNSTENLERQNIAREFKVSLERARFDSVRRRASDCNDMSRVEITSATSYSLITDMNQNGTLEPVSETRFFNFASRAAVQMVAPGTYPMVVRFDQRGGSTTGTCATPATTVPNFVFCNLPCTSTTANAVNSNIIYISPTGTATMMYGGESVPNFNAPTVTNVNTNLQVNPLLAVWDPEAATPSPSPSTSPSTSPVTSPPTTPPTSPSPSPAACAYDERPAHTGCECQLPMWVRNNGKCQ
jgi:Tfp pilus assembly protein FimT